MRMFALATTVTVLGCVAAQAAQPVSDDDREVHVVRWYDVAENTVRMEIVSDPWLELSAVICVAANESGEPVATTMGLTSVSWVEFNHISADDITFGYCWPAV